jgi:hypothetical protein
MHALIVWRREACSATQVLQLAVVGVQQSASTVYEFLQQQHQRSHSNSRLGWTGLQEPSNRNQKSIGHCTSARSSIGGTCCGSESAY